MVLVQWILRSQQRFLGNRPFLLLWLTLAGLGVFWLPAAVQDLAWWPLVAGLLVSLAWLLRRAARRPPASAAPAEGPPSSRRLRLVGGAAAAGAVAGLLALGALGRGADPEPETDIWTVFLLPASVPFGINGFELPRPSNVTRSMVTPLSIRYSATTSALLYESILLCASLPVLSV